MLTFWINDNSTRLIWSLLWWLLFVLGVITLLSYYGFITKLMSLLALLYTVHVLKVIQGLAHAR